jgi:hypothetical protein
MKSEYGPTLGRLLAPRWRAASRVVRATIIAACVVLLVAVVGLALTLENASYSHGGTLPFSFAYRGLYRVKADPGAFVKIEGRSSTGALKYSYEVYPLTLPAYSGSVWGELPRYASGYIEALSRREPQFQLSGEGKTKLTNEHTGYQVNYTTEVEGQEMFARNVLILPEGAYPREGVVIAMLTASTASTQVRTPSEVAETGILLRPLKTFTFG